MANFTFFAVLLVALAIAFAISALWQRSRPLAIALSIAIALGAGALYWFKGEPAALDPANIAAPTTIEEAIAQLERLVAANPDDFDDQAALARAYMAAKQYDRARAAYARAQRLKPEDTDILAEHAEALLYNSPDRRFPTEAVQMLERAVEKNPQNQRGLFFLGLHHRMSGRPVEAVAIWERLLSQLDAATSDALRKQIADARRDAGMPAIAAPAPLLKVEVRLDPSLARQAAAGAAGAVLYVFARTVEGEGPPISVKRLDVDSWPVEVELGDGDSPMPTAKLSTQAEAALGARLSLSGNATPASGDLEAELVRVRVGGHERVVLVLDRAIP